MSEVTVERSERLATLSDEDCRAAALAWVNNFRARYGLERLRDLPPGIGGEGRLCVLANALADVVDRSASLPPSSGRSASEGDPPGFEGVTFVRDGRVQRRPMPEAVAEFARRFDEGRYPDLEISVRTGGCDGR